MIVKAEHSSFGANPRFVVTNLPYGERYLHDRVYGARGDMENRIPVVWPRPPIDNLIEPPDVCV